MSKHYIYRDNKFSVRHVDPEVAAIELEKIRRQNNGLRPKEIVDAARPDGNPLHPIFQWDDFEAAEQWRRVQARHLVKAIRVVVDEDNTEPAYVNVKVDGEQWYEPVSIVVQNVDLFSNAIESLKRQLASLENSITELYDLAPERKRPVVEEIFNGVIETRKRLEKELAEA